MLGNLPTTWFTFNASPPAHSYFGAFPRELRQHRVRGATLPILLDMGTRYHMKTTIDIADALLERAKRHARRSGQPLRAVVEEGIRRVLASAEATAPYQLPDLSVGDARGENPLESMSWPDLRGVIYGGRS